MKDKMELYSIVQDRNSKNRNSKNRNSKNRNSKDRNSKNRNKFTFNPVIQTLFNFEGVVKKPDF
jgi:hypothetical protein